jgi:hypothetical protein
MRVVLPLGASLFHGIRPHEDRDFLYVKDAKCRLAQGRFIQCETEHGVYTARCDHDSLTFGQAWPKRSIVSGETISAISRVTV